jgi:hypothetical protein
MYDRIKSYPVPPITLLTKRSGSLKAESRVLQCKKGYPKFQKDCGSVEYKSTGWKLASDRKSINFTDKKGIGRLKPKETRDLHFYIISGYTGMMLTVDC